MVKNAKQCLALLLGLVLVFGPVIALAQTVAGAYSATEASILPNVAPLGDVYITKNFFLGTINGNATTVIQIYPSAPFNNIGPGSNATAQYVPTRVTFVLPYCSSAAPVITAEYPPACVGGKLYYGEYSIPANLSSIPDNSTVINGAAAMAQISGQFVPNLDPGGASPAAGTITYIPSPTCPQVSPTFVVNITILGLLDIGDPTPMEYVDSVTGSSLWVTTYGLGCTNRQRSPNSAAINPAPVLLPVCQVSTPENFTGLDQPSANLMYSISSPTYTGLNNVPKGGFLYQLRVDNFNPLLFVQFEVGFEYLDKSTQQYQTAVDFSNVQYVASSGLTPAFVSFCNYQPGCTLPPITAANYMESELFELEACNCGANVVCDGNNNVQLLTPIARNTLTYFNSPLTFVPSPSCAFSIIPDNNQTGLIQNQVFSLVTAAFGGVAPLTFDWRFLGVPQSIATIKTPTQQSSVSATVFSPGTYTVEHSVTAANGYSTTCTRTFPVASGQPTICFSLGTNSSALPANSNSFTIAVGQLLTLDAACSSNPFGTPMSFSWSLYSFFNITMYPIAISTNTGPVVTATGQIPGQVILFLNVTNEVTNIEQAFYFTVAPFSPVPTTPSLAPFGTPLAPTCTFFGPATPVYIPFFQPSALPPVSNLPVAPGSPQTINPSGLTPYSGLGPEFQIPGWVTGLVVTLIILVVVGIVLCIVLRAALSRGDEEDRERWYAKQI